MKISCAVALCVVLACCVHDASSQGYYGGYGGYGNAFWNTYRRYYQTQTQTQTRVTTSYRSCGRVRYDTVRTVCCGGRVLPRMGGCGCCGRTMITLVNRMCCHGSVTYRRVGYNSCCGGRGYNTRYYSCQGGSIVGGGYNNYYNNYA
ncbi:hypothetical protein NP493_868g02002 [Ridgeia piscesae]|uniref:Galaxin-like repeats domain-containing protein n=1 Tax=Ridgeia piscesae TaxID=27915 RepID=A0AAD9KLQ0_RIDPI|nr:hypothetical protein NP493_868g02002 [Ridgeia piscesae]